MKASDNPFASILVTEGTEPAAPAAGKQRLYIDSTTHKLKRTDSSGTDVTIEGGSVAADTLFDAKGDLAAGTAADTAAKLTVGADYAGLVAEAAQSTGLRWVPGASVLLYDYTVTGSAKASLDTGVDTPNAGIAGTSAFSGAFRVLEVFLYVRIDDTGTGPQLNLYFNNDTATNYELERLQAINTTVTGAGAGANAGGFMSVPGAGNAASVFAAYAIRIPNYAGTVGYKACEVSGGIGDPTAANKLLGYWQWTWKNTGAITRIKIIANTAAKNLVVGSRLSIYAR